MTKPVDKVEIGFDLTENGVGPYFRLDDPVAGVLDNTEYILGGTIFFDITDRVKQIRINRGKSRQLDRYSAGSASIVFNNDDRAFDPTYTESPFYGQIIPRREIKISTGSELQFIGSVDDWDLEFEPYGANIAAAKATDGMRILANQTLAAGTATQQNSGNRVNTILDAPEVNWPADKRDVVVGGQTLGPDVIEADTNALAYLQLVEQSESGSLFIGKAGDLVFKSSSAAPSSDALILADDGSGITYNRVKVIYGSELLYNDIAVSSVITGNTSTAANATSQGIYGVQSLVVDNLLLANDAQCQELASWYSNLYSTPEFRFESVEIQLENLNATQQADLLALELGDVVQIRFTPGNPPVGSQIEKYAEVIRMDYSSDYESAILSIGFSTLDTTFLVLDDPVFGKIDVASLGL